MRPLFAFLHSVRGRLLGLDANQARFDILQSKLDALAASMDTVEASVEQITNWLSNKKAFPFVDKRRPGETSESALRQPKIISPNLLHIVALSSTVSASWYRIACPSFPYSGGPLREAMGAGK